VEIEVSLRFRLLAKYFLLDNNDFTIYISKKWPRGLSHLVERETPRILGRCYLLGFTGATGFVGSTGFTGAAGFTGFTGPAPRAVIAVSYAVFAALVALQ